ncbi:MAG: hypothetical protein ACRDQ1_11665, partial [Sciscionella sp.]
MVIAAVAAPSAVAQPGPTPEITSSGPLTDIWTGDDLSCQVAYAGDDAYEFYPSDTAPGDCGTFLSVGGTLYGPTFRDSEAFTPISQSAVTGDGTSTSPYRLVTVVDLGGTGLEVTQTDSYVVGDEFYRTDISIANATGSPVPVLLYRGGDCYLQGSDEGFGYVDHGSNAPACTEAANNSPPGQVEEFYPLTGSVHSLEAAYGTVWSDIDAQTDLPDTCDCNGDPDSDTPEAEDNGAAINWDLTVPADGATAVSMLTDFSATGNLIGPPVVSTGAASGVSQTAGILNGSVNPEGNSVTGCTFQWGPTTAYGNSAPCTTAVGSGSTAVPVSAAISGLSPGTPYRYRLAATDSNGTTYGSDQAFTTAPPPAPQPRGESSGPPAVATTSAPVVRSSGAGLTGVVNPDGLPTTAHFEYGLDPKYTGGGPVAYDQSTPDQSVGSDFSDHTVSGSLSGLLPNARYHARLVASNSGGTATGPDVAFTTAKVPAPAAPTLGKTANVIPIAGLVFVKLPGGHHGHQGHAVRARADAGTVVKGRGFVPLTQARQVPVGSEVDARRGTLGLVVAAPRRHTWQVRLSGSVFTVGQSRSRAQQG